VKRSARDIFIEAKQYTGQALEVFLNDACGEDAGLRQEVHELLLANEEAGAFLAGTTEVAAPAGQRSFAVTERPGQSIGRYKLLQQIGEGGFGVVWMAEQREPVQRMVALKVIKLGMDTAQVIARFEVERQALAMMDHPNIAKVLDAGATESGRPYFVMELVKGVPITAYCDECKLSIKERLELFQAVCAAVQHAHQKGVIHRDLKPSNILLTLYDGKPVPKVIDFGVAKATSARLTERTLFTEYGQFIGTPEYTAPEQAAISAIDVDTRSDVYALGVLLYELLTGTTPIEAARLRAVGFGEMQRMIRETDPPAPSQRFRASGMQVGIAQQRGVDPTALANTIRGELDWITMKALEKDRSRRYESPGALAAEISRYFAGAPVEVGPPTGWYRFRKFLRQYRRQATTMAVVLLTLSLGLVGTSLGMVWAWQERDRASVERERAETATTEAISQRDLAEEERKKARHEEYAGRIAAAYAALLSRDLTAAQDQLLRAPPEHRGWDWEYLRSKIHKTLMLVMPSQRDPASAVAWHPFDTDLAISFTNSGVGIWRDGNVPIEYLPGSASRATQLAYSPSGESLVSAAIDGTGHAAFLVWDLQSGSDPRSIRIPGRNLGLCGFVDQDTLFAFVDDSLVMIEYRSGNKWRALQRGCWSNPPAALIGNSHRSLAFVDCGRWSIVGLQQAPNRMWTYVPGLSIPLRATLLTMGHVSLRLAYLEADTQNLVWASPPASGDGYDIWSRTAIASWYHTSRLAFCRQDTLILHGGHDHNGRANVEVYDENGSLQLTQPMELDGIASLKGHEHRGVFAVIGDSGRTYICNVEDPGLGPEEFRVPHDLLRHVIEANPGSPVVRALRASEGRDQETSDEQKLLLLGLGRKMQLKWESEGICKAIIKPVAALERNSIPNKKTLTQRFSERTISAQGSAIVVWDSSQTRELLRFRGNWPAVTSLSMSPKGDAIAAGFYDGAVRVWHHRPDAIEVFYEISEE